MTINATDIQRFNDQLLDNNLEIVKLGSTVTRKLDWLLVALLIIGIASFVLAFATLLIVLVKL